MVANDIDKNDFVESDECLTVYLRKYTSLSVTHSEPDTGETTEEPGPPTDETEEPTKEPPRPTTRTTTRRQTTFGQYFTL